ncbi:TonB-dependent receptor plug domain-containing protein [Flagellimonas eckloniae]|nr:TonB-dependent receptor plug domain-containing protein [Allomuricauda eckloniae]
MKNETASFLNVVLLYALFSSSILLGQQSYQLEKIYTHTDRPFYFPGETIWFKSYLVDENNQPSSITDIIRAELVSPKGSVVKTKNLAVVHGYVYGDFEIQENWVGGIYNLKVYTNYMRNFDENLFFSKEITVQKVVVPKLLLSLDFQKEAYGKGSNVKVDFDVKDLKNNPLASTEFIINVLLRGNNFVQKEMLTNENGKSVIAFDLPKDLNTSDVVLNIQVPYQGTTESISRTVPVIMDNIDFQFMPEGGKMIEGTNNVIAFKALNEFGKPADIKGYILDANGNKIQYFESYHDGMGTLQLVPVLSTAYFAKITSPFQSDSLYALPKNHSKGTKISLLDHQIDTTTWDIFTTTQFCGTLQVLDVLDQILTEKTVQLKRGSIKVDIGISEFPRGIAKFRLINSKKDVISERLVFLNNHKALNIKLKPNKEIYAPREKVVLEIETKDFDSIPVSSNLSIAVADNALLSFADDKQDRIDSYLLMSSELQGKIHEPSFYFDPEEEKSIKAIDLVMLTHGWRDYLVHPIKKVDFLPEKRNLIEGQILDRKGNPISANLFLFEDSGEKALQFKTDQNGNFRCKIGNANSYILVAYRDDRKSLKIIEKQILSTKKIVGSPASKKTEQKETGFPNLEVANKPLQKPVQEKAVFSTSLAEDASSLDEVVVVGYGNYSRKQALGFAQIFVETDEINGLASTVSQILQGRVAGVAITNSSGVSGAGTTINIRGANSIRGSNQPLYVIDGIPYTDSFSGDQSAELQDLNPNNIESVSVLKGVAASTLYGARGANGIVIINTKKRYYRYNDKVLIGKKFNNYTVKKILSNSNSPSISSSKTFYMPVYDAAEVVSERSDFRNTIYWNPVVQTDKTGKAKLEFYNSDAITSFNIIAEGISHNGLLNHTESKYSIQRPLSITAKFPNYCSLNDTIKIPITISNNTSEDLKLKLDVNIPNEFSLLNKGDLKDSIWVASKGFLLKHIDVVPKKISENLTLNVNVQNTVHSDGFSREITVLSPYFPVKTAISGSKNGRYDFNITNLVPNSIRAELNVYIDVVGDVMNGIEGIIRQPYGCFEQTSSATYPNVMVLKYLKETGKSNTEIEVKAMDFIKKGYKRLIGFETSQGGFEWFGHTPPHETLTAFGILEFTEMKEVYEKVDQKMIDRTINWLMEQRDGEGGFHKSKKGYDSFASSPPKVANAYIVYALSEVGLNSEIEKEYQSSLQEALESEDTYRMALMALASHNMGHQADYENLIDKLLTQIKASGYGDLAVENTITRSYGKSKELETTAFIVLSLLRSTQYSSEVAKGIQYITSNREYGRFGSTQATVMSLKALIEYTKTHKRIIAESKNGVRLSVNEKSIERRLVKQENGILKIDGIEEFLSEGKQSVEIHFQNPEKTFPYTLDIKWESHLPKSSPNTFVDLRTILADSVVKVGNIARMRIDIANKRDSPVSMTTAIIGIPSGASLQPYQLKELLEAQLVDYYEVFDNYLVLYWKSLNALEEKTINLDLKAEIAGNYKSPASTVYLYYGDENKHWIQGSYLVIKP